MDEYGETALIRRASNGSTAAFTELVGDYRERLFRFLLTRTASYADAEDALQDTLVNAYRYLPSYDPKWRFSTWLYRIAINNASRQRRPPTEPVGELEDREAGPLEQCIAATERHNLWLSAKRVLNDEVFVAMWLRYVEDMSIGDIAAALERSGSWTKVNLMRGRRALDAELNREQPTTQGEVYG